MRAAILGGRDSVRRISATDHNNTPHHGADATPTRLQSSKPALRTPLQSRDGNAMMRVPTKGTGGAKISSSNMPSYDKQQNTTSRPLMPTLSANAKSSYRSPLTPRVAGSVPQTTTTPLIRRGARIETPVAASGEDGGAVSVPGLLNNNVTPRSGSRKSRVDGIDTTPTGTPNGSSMPVSSGDAFRSIQEAPNYGPGLGIIGMDKDIPKRSTVTFSQSATDANAKNLGQNSAESKFFFANEAKAGQPVRPAVQSKNSSTFCYANGESIPPPPQSSAGSVVGSNVGEQTRFFHANGTPDVPSAASHFPPRPSSSLSNASRMTSTRLGNPSPNVSFSPPQQSRPASPSKLNQYATTASARSSVGIASAEAVRPQATGRGQSANGVLMARRVSFDKTSQATGLARSSSSGSSGVRSPTLRNVSGGSSVDSPLASPLSVITSSVPMSTPEEVDGTTESNEKEVQGLIKTGHTLEQLNELAANARRERKVLDLEITNSSLEAINRTLEREMRKQTAELRRYRRLSRSGRLSIATTASMRTSTGTMSILGEDGAPLFDMSEEGEEAESEYELDISDEESVSDGASLSPSAMAESDLRHRKRDEKRLQLDLSKHQQLLVDSQKMNQSLKRCLGLTEMLIGEGKKALEYKLRVSDVELGGRVLAPEEQEQEETDMDPEGMSEVGASMLRKAREAAARGMAVFGGLGGGKSDLGVIDETTAEQLQ